MERPDGNTLPANQALAIPLAERLPAIARWLALAVVAIGVIALIGWATNIEIFKSFAPGLVTMKVNTALSLILLALALAETNRFARLSTFVVFGSLLLCFTIGILTAGEYVLRIDLHIDNLFFRDRADIAFPGRMAPTSIFCFVIYSLALLLVELQDGVFLAQIGMGLIIGISLTTLGGYLYGAPQMLSHAPYPVVAVHTAIGFMLLALGGLFKQPDVGAMRVMMADTTGGWLARRLIPTALAVPLAVGLCVVTGQRAGLYGPAFAVALTVSADIAVMTAVVWSIASLLSTSDAIRQNSERAAERHSQLKDNFLATLSHELRTPVMAILGWAVLLSKRGDMDADMQEGVNTIERNARAQTRIIEDLLDMSRIISGKMRLDVKPVDLRETIDEAIQTVRPSAQAKDLRLYLAIDPHAPPVMGDASRIQQIAWNLLSNAVKFTPSHGEIHVSLAQVESRLELIVQDSGVGIREEFLPHLFERFRQADAGTTRRHGGLGLGLSIVRQLVELHGGTVTAQSGGENLGTTFTVSFPMIAVANEAVPAPAADEIEARSPLSIPQRLVGIDPAIAKVKGLRVLVVDDEADARSLIRRVLEECDAVVVTASSADDAIAHLDSEAFDVMVCDIGMPHQNGYDLIRAIRQRDVRAGGNLPAAALTAFARSEDRTRALSSGFQLHTAKPIEPSELIAAVASLAGHARAG
jgi:signal transduction histidine kinase/ActR/RegA family two-component response regulator